MKLLVSALALGTASCAPRARPPAARAPPPLHPLARARSAAINLSEVESHAAKDDCCLNGDCCHGVEYCCDTCAGTCTCSVNGKCT